MIRFPKNWKVLRPRLVMAELRVAALGLVVIITVAFSAFAQQALTNADIVKMSNSGLGGETIVQLIKNNAASFDTSPDSLISLKKAGVSEIVIQAMISKGSSPAIAVATENQGYTCDQLMNDGVVLVDGSKKTEMKYIKTGMGAKNSFFSIKGKATLPGQLAQLRIRNQSPVFENIAFPTNVQTNGYVLLARLDVRSDKRELTVMKASAISVKDGISNENSVASSVEEIATLRCGDIKISSVRVRPKVNLAPGEYVLIISGTYYFDFGVDP